MTTITAVRSIAWSIRWKLYGCEGGVIGRASQDGE